MIESDSAEASEELAYSLRRLGLSVFGELVAFRHKGDVYAVREEFGELTTYALPAEEVLGGRTADGEKIVDVPEAPTYAAN